MRSYAELWGDVGSCGEIWGAMGRYGEICGDTRHMRSYGEIRGDMGRHGEICGDMRRYAETWRGKGRYGMPSKRHPSVSTSAARPRRASGST